MQPLLSSLRRCFEGAVPAVIATCDENAMPNVAYLSQVHYIDENHVALSCDVFRLKGSDIYWVQSVEHVPGTSPSFAAPLAPSLLPVLRRSIERLGACQDLSSLLTDALACLAQEFNIQHAMVLMLDAVGDKLYTVASRGYLHSGVGSEIGLGEGIIGVAAREGVPIRIGHCGTGSLAGPRDLMKW
ncbi:hypothetical protein [Marinobacter orientalis]|uniref:GAF domain-containing protein n=1 Tax=Marinobacter orientalis TaxID=1928859 RepID=A0A7Y0RF14_9GAMM|nr:hypothetical protein [Marinobacter orientalis]NMT65013.1 hypothetical protein [Marinobacter orientalis]TGX48095.1 hypothetical protein DIT72_15860 [Marinobacter orientalis]